MNRLLTLSLTLYFTVTMMNGCGSATDSDPIGDETPAVSRTIAGTSALGRAGSWSANCIADVCARADADGNYLLASTVSNSSLMWTDIPEADGSTVRLYSRYRLDEDITTTLVNINPGTHTVLDIWSRSQKNLSIDACAQDTDCADSVLEAFSPSVETLIVGQLDALAGDAWPSGRSPFDDVYVADPAIDALDQLFDHIQFVVTEDDVILFDNNGNELTRAPLSRFDRSVSLEGYTLSNSDYQNALGIPANIPSRSAISLAAVISPSQPTYAPTTVSVNASGSSSLNGDLTFRHELTLTDGTTQSFDGAIVSTTIELSGQQIWVITATDPTGLSRTQGYIIQLWANDTDEPVFGGEGSCITPALAMNANTQNLCEEAQNGSTLGECDILNSSSVILEQSPAPCAHQTQNGGELLGVCTIISNEVRVFQYVNPLRPNNVETFDEKQARVRGQCTNNLAGTWSATP